MWSVEIKYNNHNDTGTFIDIVLPSILFWLKENFINYKIESIMQFEFIDLSPADYYSEAHGTEVQIGHKFIFNNISDAVYFKLYWLDIKFSNTNEFAKKYFKQLQQGINQIDYFDRTKSSNHIFTNDELA